MAKIFYEFPGIGPADGILLEKDQNYFTIHNETFKEPDKIVVQFEFKTTHGQAEAFTVNLGKDNGSGCYTRFRGLDKWLKVQVFPSSAQGKLYLEFVAEPETGKNLWML